MDGSGGKGGESAPEEAVRHTEFALTRNRKPYRKPAFRFERVFETMALSCGKVHFTQGQCRFNRKTS
jgi:hypothetical protein